ncbi:MAG: hypothetical protein K6T63_03845 [Alicyclobacillus herbarius]|nr:hypothetical protein [Alicyclobacillus herbarius]MCL6631743.1 hypothetical protein [Alicyclobacillus herbarius]
MRVLLAVSGKVISPHAQRTMEDRLQESPGNNVVKSVLEHTDADVLLVR